MSGKLFQEKNEDELFLKSRLIPQETLNKLKRKKWIPYKKHHDLLGFYKTQNRHINRLLEPLEEAGYMRESNQNRSFKKRRLMLINITFLATLVISIMQLCAAIISQSQSLTLITVDSIIDVLAGFIIKWTDKKIRRVDISKYPCVSFV